MKTVLVVEDTEDYAENIKFTLSRAGYNVVLASNGKDALQEAIRIKPDLILMDLLMPEQDGAETTIKIKEQDLLKNVPIVFLTAVSAADDAVLFVSGQRYPLISKMIDLKKLPELIRQYFGKSFL